MPVKKLLKGIGLSLQKARNRSFRLWQGSMESGFDQLLRRNPEDAVPLDRQTSADLELDSIFSQFNTCRTSFGDQYFWYRLHSQPGELDVNTHTTPGDFVKLVKYLRGNSAVRSRLAKILDAVGKQSRGNIVHDIWEGFAYVPRFRQLIPYWVLTGPVLVTISFLLFGVYGTAALFGMLAVNMAVFVITNRKINYLAGSLGYLHRGLRALFKIIKSNDFEEVKPGWRVDGSLKQISRRGFLFKSGFGGPQSQDLLTLLIDYLRVFLCAELFAYYLTAQQVNAKAPELRKLIPWLGKLDCALMFAEQAESNISFSYAEIHTDDAGSDGKREGGGISFVNMYNPLIEECVGQSMVIKRGMVITGMNMAGKSTFLRTLGLNQLLATSFGMVFADSFTTDRYYVVSSLKVDDDIINKKSKYFVEAERLLLMQGMIAKRKLLCVVDEILNGTNTEDRITASMGILKSLSRFPDSIVIAATHDTVIAEKRAEGYDAYYFDGEIRDEKIVFDYTAKPGIVPQRNALALLKFMGLEIGGDEIVT